MADVTVWGTTSTRVDVHQQKGTGQYVIKISMWLGEPPGYSGSTGDDRFVIFTHDEALALEWGENFGLLVGGKVRIDE